MNFAAAEPKATRNPIVKGSESMSKAALDAMRRFDGPAKGMRFRIKEEARRLRSSYHIANLAIPT